MKFFERHYFRIDDIKRTFFADPEGRRKKGSTGVTKPFRQSNATADTHVSSKSNSNSTSTFRIRDTMKLLNQKLHKLTEDPVETKVSRVIVVTETRNPKVALGGPRPKKVSKVRFAKESPTTAPALVSKPPKPETPVETPIETPVETPVETPIETPVETPIETPVETPSETIQIPTETIQEIQPSSPTCIREQAQMDATPIEEKQPESPSRRWKINFDVMSCGSSPEYFDRNIMGDWDSSPTTERLGEFKQMMSTNMEYVHEQFFGKNLGESAMFAMQKNRAEMNKLVGNIENHKNAINPVDWLMEMERPSVECHSSMMTWNDVKACLPDSKDFFEEEKTETSPVM